MDIRVDAVYENGVLKPVTPVALDEREQVHLVITPGVAAPADDPAELAPQRQALDALLAEFRALPQPANTDGFSGSDHDRVLYGRPA